MGYWSKILLTQVKPEANGLRLLRYTFLMEGGCHCGAVRFVTKTEPYWVGACYCVDCRKISGAPYTVFAGYKKDEVELLKGTPKVYQSSSGVIRSFCESCSSPFSFIYTERPDEPFLSVGVFDDPSTLKLEEHIWVSQKLPWVHITDELPQKERH
jgi:hypothetical protein